MGFYFYVQFVVGFFHQIQKLDLQNYFCKAWGVYIRLNSSFVCMTFIVILDHCCQGAIHKVLGSCCLNQAWRESAGPTCPHMCFPFSGTGWWPLQWCQEAGYAFQVHAADWLCSQVPTQVSWWWFLTSVTNCAVTWLNYLIWCLLNLEGSYNMKSVD